MSTNPKILVCPLNWGLGHASRCIPVIEILLKFNFEVHVASDGLALDLLKQEFDSLNFHSLPSYNIVYAKNGSQLLRLAIDLPGLLGVIRQEEKAIALLHSQYNFSGIISDNRPGANIQGIPSVYITHQTKVKAGIFTRVSTWMHRRYFRNFTEVWIPDSGIDGLAGELSSSNVKNGRYVGWLSRAEAISLDNKYELCAILSGPEPQRSQLEETLLKQFELLKGSILLIRGTNIPLNTKVSAHVVVKDIVTSKDLDKYVAQSKALVARSGYSTLMDLQKWQKPAVLIPTPGQPEQEYLGTYVKNVFAMNVVSQSNFDLSAAIKNPVILALPDVKVVEWESLLQIFKD